MDVLAQFYEEHEIPAEFRGVPPDMALRRQQAGSGPHPWVAVWDRPRHLDVAVAIEQLIELVKLGEAASPSV